MSIKMLFYRKAYLVKVYIFFSYFLRALLFFFITTSFLALADAYFGLRIYFSFPFYIIPSITLFLPMGIGLTKALFLEKTLVLLERWYRKYPSWLSKNPYVIFDLIQEKIHPPNSLTKWEIQNLVQGDLQRITFLPAEIWLKEIFGKTTFLLSTVLLFVLLILFQGKISPFRIFQELAYLPETELTLLPPPGNYLMGRPLKISLTYLSPKYEFLHFENSQTQEIITYDKTILWETFTEPFALRLVAKRGIEKVYSKPYSYNPILPGHFRRVVFQIIPPPSLSRSLEPFFSEGYLLNVHYGSQINAFIYYSGDAEIFWKNRKLKSQNQMAKFSFVFSTKTEKEIFFTLRDKNTGIFVDSPKYYFQEAPDEPPKVQILVSKNKFFFPEKGFLHLAYRALDDFGFRALYFILKNEKGDVKILSLPIVPKKIRDGYIIEGSTNINLKQISGNLIQIALVARDNSMIPSALENEKAQLGQIGISDFLEIHFAKNNDEKQNFELALQKEMESNLSLLYEEFQNLEQDFQKLFQRLAQKETGDKIAAELNQWIKKRQELQEKIQQYTQVLNQSKSTSIEESERKKSLLKELNFVLEEKIAEKERELKKLLENFPQDFETSEEIKERLSRQEYLKSLENAIEHLKQMQFLRTLKELEKKLAKEITETENLIKESYQAKTLMKEKSREQVERLKNLTNESTLSELSQKMLGQIQETQEKVEKAQNLKETITALSKRREILNSWREELKKLRQKSGLAKYEEAVKKLQEVAFGINRIAEVWSQRSQIHRKNQIFSEKELDKLRKIATELFDSYLWETRKLEGDGFFSGSLLALFKQGESYFREITRERNLDFAYSFYDKSRLLRYKLNQISKELLRQMGFMKMSAMGMAQEIEQEELGEISEKQKGLGESLKKMGEGQKSQGLTESEKAYLEDLAQRQNFLAQKLSQLAESANLQKNYPEIEEIAQDMQKLAEDLQKLNTVEDIHDLAKKQEQIEEKFLRMQQSRRQKPEWDMEREAVQAREYYLSPSKQFKEKLPEKKLIHFPIPEGERGKFYLRFRQNLEKLP